MDKDFEENPLLIITMGGIILTGVISGAAAWVTAKSPLAIQWLIDHRIFVPADQAVIVVGDGGLDVARVLLIVALLILVMVVSVMIGMQIRRYRRRRVLREITTM